MGTKTSRVAIVALALGCIVCSSGSQATTYGVNRTITQGDTVADCSLFAFSCTSHCSDVLEAKCQQSAPSFCNNGDFFLSASFGGVYPSSNCSGVTGIKPSPFCVLETETFYTGSVTCTGSCNALCEVNEFCECAAPFDCVFLYGDPSPGTWECLFCQCLLTNSPLVLHIPDYLSTGGGSQSWWKRGFCGPESPTICMDWKGDGNITCTAWLEPGSENAFVVSLSGEDMLQLLEWDSVRPEPWRHFFGNVTMGPEGDHPYDTGFAALAAYCGQDPKTNPEIDLTECGGSLFVWNDRDGDGQIDVEELLDFQDLGITALDEVKTTGKKDKCGNTFPAESNAICSHGKCGTVLDVFFQPR